jgi:hypothetical protein
MASRPAVARRPQTFSSKANPRALSRLVQMRVARQPAAARCRVASPTPSPREIASQDAPESRREAILVESTTRLGHFRCLPFDLAFRRPALTRS